MNEKEADSTAMKPAEDETSIRTMNTVVISLVFDSATVNINIGKN